MSRASRIIVADGDSKNAGLLAFGFEREGIEPVVVSAAADVPRMAIAGDVHGVVLSMATGALTTDALKGLRAAGPMVAKLPVLALGDTTARAECLGAGAVDFLPRPNFVRDVVAMVRFHTLRKPAAATVWAGELGDFAGIFFLIRGLSSTQRTGVLTIVRSLRRAELRFYEGEVTSAQVGSLHGMAALHQVLLWTEGKLEFRAEAVVRRQQIPLQPGELIDDLGRFLRDFHELAPDLSPGVVLEQDLRRVAECVDKIPKEVNPVLRLFDGARLLSDIVEDSPFRVFETVKIAARLVKLGALKAVVQSRTRGDNAALKVDDWLVGSTPVQGVPVLTQAADSEPVGPRPGVPASPPAATAADGSAGSVASARQKKKAKKEREREAAQKPVQAAAAVKPAATTPAAAAPGGGVVAAPAARQNSDANDWGRLTGAASSVWDLPGYAPVVPSQVATGEISAIARPEPDANLAAAGKVVAQDLTSAVSGVTRGGASGPVASAPRTDSPKVMIDDAASASSGPTITGKAAERVDEISAPVPREIPVLTTRPGPAPAPVPVAPAILPTPAAAPAEARAARTSAPQPVVARASDSGRMAAPQPAAPARAAVTPRATRVPETVVASPHLRHEAPAESRMHSQQSSRADGNGVVSGVLSGALEARSAAPMASEPELAEKIVVVDAEFDPPRPPSVEIEIVRAPSDADEEVDVSTTVDVVDPSVGERTAVDVIAAPDDHTAVDVVVAPSATRTAVDAPAAPPVQAGSPATGTPTLRNIADEEPSDAAARIPHVLIAPQGLAPVVPVATRMPTPAPVVPPAPASPAPEAVVVATPSAPTVQVIVSGPTTPPPPVAAPSLLASAPAIIAAAPAPIVPVAAPMVTVPPPAVAAPAPSVAAVAEEVTRSAADAAHAAARALSFDAIDEEFFNQEHQFANAKVTPSESFDDLDGHHAPPPKRGFWSRLLGNAPPPQTQRKRRPTTVPPPSGKAASTTGPHKPASTTGPHKAASTTGPHKAASGGSKAAPGQGGKPQGNGGGSANAKKR